MKHTRVLFLGLALCLGASQAQAANEPNTQRIPTEQVPGTGTIDRDGGPMGAGTPGDGLGIGTGTDANDTDNTGGDGTAHGKPGEAGPGTGNSGDLDDSGSPGGGAPRNDDAL